MLKKRKNSLLFIATVTLNAQHLLFHQFTGSDMNSKIYQSLLFGITTSLLIGCNSSSSDKQASAPDAVSDTSSRNDTGTQDSSGTSAAEQQCQNYGPYTSLSSLLTTNFNYDNEVSFTNPSNGEKELLSLEYSLSFSDDLAKIAVVYQGTDSTEQFNETSPVLGFALTPLSLQTVDFIKLTTSNNIPQDVAAICGFININSAQDIGKLKQLIQLFSSDPETLTSVLDFYLAGIDLSKSQENIEFDPRQALINAVSESFTPKSDQVFFTMENGTPELIDSIDAFSLLTVGINTLLGSQQVIDLFATSLLEQTGLDIEMQTAREISEELLIERLLGSFTGLNSSEFANILVQAASLGDTSELEKQLSAIIAGGPTDSNTLVADLIAAISSTEQGANAIANLVGSSAGTDSETQELLTENPELLNYVLTNPDVLEEVQNSDGSSESTRQILTDIASSDEGAELIVDAIADNAPVSSDVKDVLLQNPGLTAAIVSNPGLRDDIQADPTLLEKLSNNPDAAAQLNNNDEALDLIAQNPDAFSQFF